MREPSLSSAPSCLPTPPSYPPCISPSSVWARTSCQPQRHCHTHGKPARERPTGLPRSRQSPSTPQAKDGVALCGLGKGHQDREAGLPARVSSPGGLVRRRSCAGTLWSAFRSRVLVTRHHCTALVTHQRHNGGRLTHRDPHCTVRLRAAHLVPSTTLGAASCSDSRSAEDNTEGQRGKRPAPGHTAGTPRSAHPDSGPSPTGRS